MRDPELSTEEINLGGCFYKHPSVFSPESSHFASISGTYAIVYNVTSGKRRFILNGDSHFCGLKWKDENTLFTISSDSSVNTWDLKEGTSIAQFKFNYNGHFLWTYDYEGSVFVVTVNKAKEQEIIRLNFDEGTTTFCVKLPLKILHRRAVCPANRFALYCEGRNLQMLPYGDFKLKGPEKFYFSTVYQGLPRNSISFNSVTIVNDSVFAVMSTGRIIFWHEVSVNGLKSQHKAFIHSHYTEPKIAVTPLFTIFCGTANSQVDKWNSVSTGGGRYERNQVMERMDAPIEAVCLSPDSNFLLAIMADNSMLILNTVSLAVVSRPPSLHWPSFYSPLEWLGLYTDIEHPDYILTNARTGYIQWADPTRWTTVGEFDVSKENPPPQDCVSMPKYNWTNVYAVSCTSSMIVTAECRRSDLNKTLLKFFFRMTPGAMYDIKQLGCIKLDHRIKFIRTNMEEVRHDPSEQLIHDHYVVTVNEFGKIETYFPNSYEAYRWNLDLKRIFAWQQTKIIDCSTIRSDMMATVNAENANSGLVVVIWDTSTANVLDFIDKIQDVRQVRWCPPHKFRESTLLIASNELITAYDCEAKNFLWIIMEPNLKLYTNLFVIIAYGSKKAYVINYRDGSAIKRMEFTRNQDQVVATGSASNIRLSGLDSKGLSLLKPDTPENSTLRDMEVFTKSTPFSALIQQARADSQPSSATNQQLHRSKLLSARKLLEGSVYSLAPITKLAPAFIQSCLVSKSSMA